MMTVLEVLRGAAEYLEKKGVESPRLNAEHLLARVLGVRRLELYLQFDRPLGEAERAPLRDLVRERGTGRPLQHLLGTAWFCGREFLCDSRALIPRPETEQLVEAVLARLPATAARVADVGTGSGVIAITLALERPACRVVATDLHPEALALAGENAARLSAVVEFFEADLLPSDAGEFDAILANLPYIPSAEIAALDREVRHDPLTALDGGADGTDPIRRLAALVGRHLAPGGFLALEIGDGQSAALAECLAGHNFRDIARLTDYQKKERFLIAHHG